MWGLYQLAAECAHRFGYRYIETPAFEHTELFRRTSGESSDVVRKEMYTFEDRGERSLTLRPEATAAIVRAYLERGRGLPSPFKVFTVETMWRYGRPQSGRLREFRQFDAEVIDEPGWGADVETIALGGELLRTAAVGQVELQINSIGDGNCRPAYREELVAYLRAHRQELRDEHRDRFEENPLRILDCKDEGCKQVAAGAPKIVERLCEPCREHFQGVLEGLRAEGIEPVLTDTLVRGLDYYTRTTWEWVSPRLAKGQDSVGGGGRYDGLAEILGGPPTPGVGFAIGLERVLMLREGGEPVLNLERPETFVVGIGELSLAHTIARELRRRGVSAEVALEPRPLGTQLKMADRSNARYAVIVGSREAQAGTLTLRDLESGDQEELEFDQVVLRIATRRGTQE